MLAGQVRIFGQDADAVVAVAGDAGLAGLRRRADGTTRRLSSVPDRYAAMSAMSASASVAACACIVGVGAIAGLYSLSAATM